MLPPCVSSTRSCRHDDAIDDSLNDALSAVLDDAHNAALARWLLNECTAALHAVVALC